MKDKSFLLISHPSICAMPVKECNESLIDLKTLPFLISNARAAFYDGYTKVRESVAQKLLAAKEYLPPGINFYFSEGHRPISLQQQMFADYLAHLTALHPSWDEKHLRDEATKYIASPHDVPPHSTGGAIDITLIDEMGRELDMGSHLDEIPDRNENRNFTLAENIAMVAKANRQILIDVLSQQGFINYPAEWWHWSYGDKYWAYHSKKPHAIYGSV